MAMMTRLVTELADIDLEGLRRRNPPDGQASVPLQDGIEVRH
jgi:hypothetical protein